MRIKLIKHIRILLLYLQNLIEELDSSSKYSNYKHSKNNKYNINLFIHKVDSSKNIEVEEYFLELKKKINKIDVLINNVGIAGPTGKLEDLRIEEWCKTIDVKINSHFNFSKNAIPLLKINGGSIFNLSSTAGIFGFPLRTPYAASKWAIIGLT